MIWACTWRQLSAAVYREILPCDDVDTLQRMCRRTLKAPWALFVVASVAYVAGNVAASFKAGHRLPLVARPFQVAP